MYTVGVQNGILYEQEKERNGRGSVTSKPGSLLLFLLLFIPF